MDEDLGGGFIINHKVGCIVVVGNHIVAEAVTDKPDPVRYGMVISLRKRAAAIQAISSSSAGSFPLLLASVIQKTFQ